MVTSSTSPKASGERVKPEDGDELDVAEGGVEGVHQNLTIGNKHSRRW